MSRRTDRRREHRGAAAAWLLPPLLAIAVGAAALPGAFHHRLTGDPPLGQRWVATATTVDRIRAIDPEAAALYFNRPRSFVLGAGTPGGSVAALAWADEGQFERDLAAGAIPPAVRFVMYDPEGWPSTPRSEQRDPITAMRAFARTARAAGYGVILTPHPNLVEVKGATCGPTGNETMTAAFLRCGIEGAAAQLSDIVEIQGQWLEWDPIAYRTFVEAAADQARRAHPGVVVLAGLSTRFASTPQTLLDAWDSVSDVVDGHYLAVPEGIRPEVAAAFLRELAEQRP